MECVLSRAVREVDSSLGLSVVRLTTGLLFSSGFVAKFSLDGPTEIDNCKGVTLQNLYIKFTVGSCIVHAYQCWTVSECCCRVATAE